jgi:ABC-type transporter Mla subunit MlaD
MATHAELAARLLRDAATFFRTVADQNPALKDAMAENAQVFDDVAALVESDPLGEMQGS